MVQRTILTMQAPCVAPGGAPVRPQDQALRAPKKSWRIQSIRAVHRPLGADACIFAGHNKKSPRRPGARCEKGAWPFWRRLFKARHPCRVFYFRTLLRRSIKMTLSVVKSLSGEKSSLFISELKVVVLCCGGRLVSASP